MKVFKFGAVWCQDCLVMRPIWEDIEKEIEGFESKYFDIDSDLGIEKFNITTVPSFLFFDNSGKEFLRLEGLQNRDDLIDIIKKNLNK